MRIRKIQFLKLSKMHRLGLWNSFFDWWFILYSYLLNIKHVVCLAMGKKKTTTTTSVRCSYSSCILFFTLVIVIIINIVIHVHTSILQWKLKILVSDRQRLARRCHHIADSCDKPKTIQRSQCFLEYLASCLTTCVWLALTHAYWFIGKLDKGAVLKAICSGFQETTEPAICLSEGLHLAFSHIHSIFLFS